MMRQPALNAPESCRRRVARCVPTAGKSTPKRDRPISRTPPAS